MSLQRIAKPYRIWTPPEALATGRFNESESFSNKEKAKAFVKRVREIVPDFNPSLRVFFRYEDSVTGKPYVSRVEYDREQDRVKEWRAREDEKLKAENDRLNREQAASTGRLVPSPGYVHGYIKQEEVK